MPTEDQRRGKLLPDPVTPLTEVCFKITIPNAVQYRAALFGVLGQLTQWYTWDHQLDGTTCDDCEEAAQLWSKALAEAYFEEDCMGMACDDVADCIENDAAVQAALAAAIAENEAIRNSIEDASGGFNVFGGSYSQGQPLSPSQMSAQLNVPDLCAYDVFWAQTDQYVEWLIDLGQDTFERLQLYSEALASGKNAVGGAFIAKLKNGSTVGKVTEFINWAIGTMKNAYESADTTDNRNALKCALFCAMRDDCLISIGGTLDVLNDRLGGILSPSDLDNLPALAAAMQTVVFNPALAMDLWVLFLMGTAKTAGLFGVQGIDETIQLVLAVAVNDANDDWELLCEDCPSAEGFIVVGNVGTTTVVKDGDVYTITGGYVAAGPNRPYLYIQSSVNGEPNYVNNMTYTGMSVSGFQFSEWGGAGGNFTTTPPNSAPPPSVVYVGGPGVGMNTAAMTIVITTTMLYQGIVQGV